MTKLLSHAPRYPDIAAALSANQAKIDASPASDAEKAERRALLGTLAGTPFWAYLIVNGGLNGDWTDYMIHRYRDDRSIAGLERFFTLPLQEATRQRDAHFRTALIQHLKPGVRIASIPCGFMRDVLSLPFPEGSNFTLDGYDLDEAALEGARALAAQYGVSAHCHFAQADAWELGATAAARYDICVSNGLNIYVAEPERRVALYRSFQEMLVSGGILITSALTWPPGAPKPSEWTLDKVDMAGLMLTQRIYGMIEPRWSSFCSTADTISQLGEAGFTNISVVPDAANMMPTFVARKV
jgi:2-polyprenyl-3-methyl-5-hydroxy-6-metoxy-1,4-benzoquinol methylase